MAIAKRTTAPAKQAADFDLASVLLSRSSKSKTIEAIGETADGKYIIFEDELGQQGAMAPGLIQWNIENNDVTMEGNTLSHENGFKLNKKNNLFAVANVQERVEL